MTRAYALPLVKATYNGSNDLSLYFAPGQRQFRVRSASWGTRGTLSSPTGMTVIAQGSTRTYVMLVVPGANATIHGRLVVVGGNPSSYQFISDPLDLRVDFAPGEIQIYVPALPSPFASPAAGNALTAINAGMTIEVEDGL